MRRLLMGVALGGALALVAGAVAVAVWGPGWVEGELRRQAAARGWAVEWDALSLGLGEVELVGVRATRGRLSATVERVAVTPRWTREGLPVERVAVEGAAVEVALGDGAGVGGGGAGARTRWGALPPIEARRLALTVRRGGAVIAEGAVAEARWSAAAGAAAVEVRGWVEWGGARVEGEAAAARWVPGADAEAGAAVEAGGAVTVERARVAGLIAGMRVEAAVESGRWAPGEAATLDGARAQAEGRGVRVEAPAQAVTIDVEGRSLVADGSARVTLGAAPRRPRALEVTRPWVTWTAAGPVAAFEVAGGRVEVAVEGPLAGPDGVWIEAEGLDLSALARLAGRAGVAGQLNGALWVSRPLDARDGVIGRVEVRGGSLTHPAVAPTPVEGIEGVAYGIGWRDDFGALAHGIPDGIQDGISKGIAGIGAATPWHLAWWTTTGGVSARGVVDGVGADRDATLRLRAAVDPVACDTAWRAVPAALRGPYADARFGGKAFDEAWIEAMPGCSADEQRRAIRRGRTHLLRCDPSTFAPRVDLELPLHRPFDLRLHTRGVAGACPAAALKASAAPPALVGAPRRTKTDDVDWLLGAFSHPVDAAPPDDRVGPGDASWVELDALPPFVAAVMYLSEDRSLFERPGALDVKLISRALKFDVQRGRYVYGGSTLPQQLVKNLFLQRDKTLARKLQEAVIANRVTVAIPPERVLALYVNCIEFAPGVYGLRRAARHYFGVAPEALTPAQAVFLATAKPSPRYAETLRKRGATPDTEHYRTYMRRLYDRLVEVGALTEAEVAAQGPLRVTFEGSIPYPPPPEPTP